MNTISIEDAHYFLSQCTGVLLEGRYVEPIVFDIEGDYDNEWLILEWDEFDGENESVVTVSFLEKENQTVLLEGSKMTLMTPEGNEEEIILLKEWKPTINS